MSPLSPSGAEPASSTGSVTQPRPHVPHAKNSQVPPHGGPHARLRLDRRAARSRPGRRRRADPAPAELHARVPPARPSVQNVVVATMPEDKSTELQGHPQIVLEEGPDAVLPQDGPPAEIAGAPLLVSPFGTSVGGEIRLVSAAGRSPVADATVYLYGTGIPAQGRTDAAGTVTLDPARRVRRDPAALDVNPLRDHWSMWVNRPASTSGQANTVVLQSLAVTPSRASRGASYSAGAKAAMRLDNVPAQLDGRGIRCWRSSTLERRRSRTPISPTSPWASISQQPPLNTVHWNRGAPSPTACTATGAIAGTDNAVGWRGFAARGGDARSCAIFPGGRVSSLLDAVDYCIEQQMDLVNMSLGAGGISQIFLQKLAVGQGAGRSLHRLRGTRATRCSSRGSRPTSSRSPRSGRTASPRIEATTRAALVPGDGRPWVLLPRSSRATAPRSTCAGRASQSCPRCPTMATWRGTAPRWRRPTSWASPRLGLAHHPDFQTPALRLPYGRLESIASSRILKTSATTLQFGDPQRSGAGLPDSVWALGLGAGAAPWVSATESSALRSALDLVRDDFVAVGLLDPVVAPQFMDLPPGFIDRILPIVEPRRGARRSSGAARECGAGGLMTIAPFRSYDPVQQYKCEWFGS